MLISIAEMIEQLSQGPSTKNNNVMKPELDLSSPYCLSELLVLGEATHTALLTRAPGPVPSTFQCTIILSFHSIK